MARATEEALGTRTQVVLQEMRQLPSDEEAGKVARDLRADVVVELVWSDARRTRATVRVRMPATSTTEARWIQREIGFARSDAPAERGRTLGFAAASMLPGGPPAPETQPPSLPATAPPPAAPAPVVSSPPTSPLPPPESGPQEDDVLAPARRNWVGLFEALAVGTMGLDGEGPGLGGALAGELAFARKLAVRLAVEARTASVPSLAASAVTVLVAPGLAWRPLESTRSRPFALGGRAEALLGGYGLSHAGVSAAMQWSPGARGLLDAAWMFSEGAGISLAAGGEVPFRAVQVVEGGGAMRTYYPLRFVAEMGVRAGF